MVPENGQILIHLDLKTEVSSLGQVLEHDAHAAHLCLHQKASVDLSHTGKVTGEGELISRGSSVVLLIDNQPYKPLSFFRKLPVFFDGIDLFPAEAMFIDFADLTVAEVIGVHIVGIDLQHIDQGD